MLFISLWSKEGVANFLRFLTCSIKKNSFSKKTLYKHTSLSGLVGSYCPEQNGSVCWVLPAHECPSAQN